MSETSLYSRGSAATELPIIMCQASQPQTEKTTNSVPATDSSWGAIRVFLAVVCSEGLLFGICLSFGVFQDSYTHGTSLPHDRHSSWIGVLAGGIAYLGAPLTTYCCQAFDIPLPYYVYCGWLLCSGALLASAFCQDVKTMIVTQGLLFGLGLLVLEMPTLIILNSWFVKRRGLAYGVLYGVTDLFGVAWGFLADALLKHHGIRATFLVFAGICFVIPAIALFFLRERPPATADTGSEASSLDNVKATVPPRQDATGLTRNRPYYRSATFYILLASNLFQAFAFYLPFIYLPSYTTALGHSSSTGAIVLAVANIAQVFGEVGFGRLSDKINVHSLVFCSALVASLSAFFIWSFATSLPYLIPFALLFGSFGSGFLSLWPRMGTLYGEVDASMIFSIMSFGRGFGVIASGPISTVLLQRDLALATQPPRSVRHDYRPVVLFVGGCMAASATLGLLGWLMSQSHGNSKMSHKGCERTETTV